MNFSSLKGQRDTLSVKNYFRISDFNFFGLKNLNQKHYYCVSGNIEFYSFACCLIYIFFDSLTFQSST